MRSSLKTTVNLKPQKTCKKYFLTFPILPLFGPTFVQYFGSDFFLIAVFNI